MNIYKFQNESIIDIFKESLFTDVVCFFVFFFKQKKKEKGII